MIKLFVSVTMLVLSLTIVQAEKIDDLTLSSYVNDYANLIDDERQSSLEQRLSQFAKTTSHQILVVTVNTMDGDYIEHYSIRLAEKAKAGTAQHDNGAILLIAKDDREMRIEVGYGLEPVLTDGISRQIIDTILTPAFQQNNFTKGIIQATDQIMSVTQGEQLITGQSGGESWSEDSFFLLLYVGAFVMTRLSSVLGRTKSWWLGGVIGAIGGAILVMVIGRAVLSVILAVGVTVFGFVFDYIVSRHYQAFRSGGSSPLRWAGGRRGPGSRSGGFGGFSGGGGSFGGGGASGNW